MIRVMLSFFVSGLVLLLGIATAWQESRNHAHAAELDRLQMEAEWCERVSTEVAANLARLEFECLTQMQQTPPKSQVKNAAKEYIRGQE